MAEAAGLALGAVALVSLFQTAVEFLEYFEIAKSLRADQDLATTKINLLEVRLKQWGQEIHIQDVGQEWEGWLRRQEGGIITNCLIGISNILGNANQLTSKYGLDRTRKPGWLSPFSGLTRSSSDSRRSASKTNTFTPASATIKFSRESSTSVGSRVTWAIKDKKRFESLISELDFLITNLERVSGRLHHQDTSPSSHSSSQARVFPTPQATRMASQAVTIHNLPKEKRMRPENTEKPSSSDRKKPADGADTTSASSYNQCAANGDANQVNGDVDPTIGGQHKFDGQNAGERANQVNGNMGADVFKALLAAKKTKGGEE